MFRLRARWVVPVATPPIENGVVCVADGQILAVGASDGAPAQDLGDVAILPGFVNAHTHLDLSAAARPWPRPTIFTDWLTTVVRGRQSVSQAQTAHAMTIVLDQWRSLGVTLVGDITQGDVSEALLNQAGLPAIVFREVLGLKPERSKPMWETAESWLRGPAVSPTLSRGVSPHAPYSSARWLYQQTHRVRAPRCTHWLESPAERTFLESGAGEFREFLESLGAWTDAWRPTTHFWEDYLLGDESATPWTLVHCNQATRADVERLCRPEFRRALAGVVVCPRTCEYFGFDHHPWPHLVEAGIAVGLGTDSLASNPDLDVFAEAKSLASGALTPLAGSTVSATDPKVLVNLLTLGGASALGQQNTTGSLSPGKRADLAVVAYNPNEPDLYASLFDPSSRVIATYRAGKSA